MYSPKAIFRPRQREAVKAVIKGESNILVVLPTGYSKTDVIIIPAIMQPGLVSIIIVLFISIRDNL